MATRMSEVLFGSGGLCCGACDPSRRPDLCANPLTSAPVRGRVAVTAPGDVDREENGFAQWPAGACKGTLRRV